MRKDIVKAFLIGLVGTIVVLGIAFVGTHTLLEFITLPFTMPLAVLATQSPEIDLRALAGRSMAETVQSPRKQSVQRHLFRLVGSGLAAKRCFERFETG